MKYQKIQETTKCDFCGTGEHCYERCISCGKDVCYDCTKTRGVTFRHSTWASGSGDGFYCSECLGKQTVLNSSLYRAYKAIQNLRSEHEQWEKDFDRRRKIAEENLKGLQSN